MGLYINEINGKSLPVHGKANAILNAEIGATEVPEPKEWEENLVCVVENSFFDGAGYAFSPKEMEAFKKPDGRKKRWLLVPNAKEIAH